MNNNSVGVIIFNFHQYCAEIVAKMGELRTVKFTYSSIFVICTILGGWCSMLCTWKEAEKEASGGRRERGETGEKYRREGMRQR